jgi:serine/threonine protein kinase
MESSQFSDGQSPFESIEQIDAHGATCDSFRVKLYGKLHFLKRLKPAFTGDIRYQEALRKEFETGYRLEHPNLVRYISLTDDGILMEYVDGETLSQRIAAHPEYFTKQNTDKFLHQLLDAVACLHSHQVLHLDLKPDNVLLTRINSDVKLIDLGCCYTDTFADTPGRTNAYAAPEQLSGGSVDERTDIYAIGKILERLPHHDIYNKVIARCMAADPSKRYQSVEEVKKALRRKHRYGAVLAVLVITAAILAALWALPPHQQPTTVPVKQEAPKDSVTILPMDTPLQQPPVTTSVPALRQQYPQPSDYISKDNKQQMEKELERMMDAAYSATIATFCDSVFPPQVPSSGKAWMDASTEFHNQTLQIANRLIKNYPNIPESTIRQDCENHFQSLVSSVFNQMRANAQP